MDNRPPQPPSGDARPAQSPEDQAVRHFLAPARHEGESFDEYRERRAAAKRAVDGWLRGRPVVAKPTHRVILGEELTSGHGRATP